MTAMTTTTPRIPSVARLRSGTSRILWAVAPFAALVMVWQLVVTLRLVPTMWLPAPGTVWDTFVGMLGTGTYMRDITTSFGRLALGVLVAGSTGIGLGLVMGRNRALAEFLEPVITFMNALSGIAWVPLAILWFGLGTTAVTFIIWNSMFFLILFNTITGVRSVPRAYESAMRTMGAGSWAIVRDALFPGALPNIVTGLRQAIGFGWRALMAAELLAASSGLGYLIYKAGYSYRADIVLVVLITVGMIWLCLDRLLFVPFENWTIRRWRLTS